jgi:hypothetical protein
LICEDFVINDLAATAVPLQATTSEMTATIMAGLGRCIDRP